MPRQSLTRERVIARAIDLADRDGLEAVSMRTLSAELGVVPMALYKHVAGREALLGGMIDAVVARYPPIEPGAPWKSAVRRVVLGARGELLQHPWLPRAIGEHPAPTPVVLAHMNAVSGAFLEGGIALGLAHHAMHALGPRIWGYAVEAFDARPAMPEPSDEATVRMLAQAFPHVLAISSATAADGGCDDASEFEFTLDLLLDGIEGLHRAGWSPAPRA